MACFCFCYNIVNVVGDYTLRVTILKQKFSKIINSRLQQGSRGANSVATISECADEIYFVLARSERIPFGVKTCESLLPVDRCDESNNQVSGFENVANL